MWHDGARWLQAWSEQGQRRIDPVGQEFDLPDCPRHMVVDRSQLTSVASGLRETAELQGQGYRPPDSQDVDLLAEIMRGRGLPQRDVVALALDRETRGDLLTAEQANVLGATRLLRRVEVRGGAGSGKTWLAVDQARRLARDGERVALTGLLRREDRARSHVQEGRWVVRFQHGRDERERGAGAAGRSRRAGRP